jgi:hypothetical protein
VKRSVGRYNRNNQPTHFDRVYVWAPNFEALSAWWEANRPQKRRSGGSW